MAEDIQQFSITVAAGTLSSAPQVDTIALDFRLVRVIEIRVPPGPLGNVGFAITNASTVVIPANGTNWIIANDDYMTWRVDGYVESGSWGIRSYNTGAFPHTLYFRFHSDLPQAQRTAIGTPIPSGVISQ